ncbi:MAG TPA: hypothetical protein VL860_10245 [Planctomycetota bacterium]|nr:hypothetical protein [Planctomycetota bacterium]
MQTQLNLLRTLHLIMAAINLLGTLGMAAIIAFGMWDSFFTGRRANDDDICALVCCGFMFLIVAGAAIGNYLAAGWIPAGRRHSLCFTVAVINIVPLSSTCLPAGIALGIFTLVVLLNRDVKQFFADVQAGVPLEEARLRLDEATGTGAGRRPKPPLRRDEDEEIDVNGDWDASDRGKKSSDWDRPPPPKPPPPKNRNDWR